MAGVCLLLYGCGGPLEMPKEPPKQTETEETQVKMEPASSQVLEVGIMADGTNPYAVVASENFCRKAGDGSYPVVVEYHDSRDGCDTQKAQLKGLKERGVDLLLIHVVDLKRQEELAEEIKSLDIPVLYFGTRPGEALLEETGGTYVGLEEEEEKELSKVLEEGSFEESGFRELAESAGGKLYGLAIKMRQ